MKKLVLLVYILALSIYTTGQQPITNKEINKDVLLEANVTTSMVPYVKSGNTKGNGNDCLDAIIVSLPSALPYSDIYQTTCGKENYYEGTCLGSFDGGEDIIYELIVSEDVVVDINLDPLGNTYTGILIDNACPPGETCMDYSTTYGSDPHEFTGVTLTAAEGPYYIMIDTWPAPDCIPEFNLTIAQTALAPLNFDLKVFLEGPFNGIDMKTDLNDAGLMPIIQPYNVEPWNYEGTESISAIPNGDVVDWILIELRETAGDASTALNDSVITRKAAFLLNNGQIVDLDGISLPEFDITITDNLYVVLWHRNHLAIMSSSPLVETKGTYMYDFIDQLDKAYLSGQKEIGTGIFGMIAGDCDGNGFVNMNDKDVNWTNDAGISGYYSSDLNFDTQSNNPDKNDIWEVNLGEESKVPVVPPFNNCGDLLYDIDGNTYNTVQIGTQCWMAENLKTTTYSNATPIPNITDNNAWQNLSSGAYVWYNNDILWKELYGALYNWYTNDANGICPAGWHVPTNDEWIVLTDFIGGAGSPYGNELKSCRQVSSPLGGNCNTSEHPRWNQHNTHYGTDDHGFAGFPGGRRNYFDGSFDNIGLYGWWWTSSDYAPTAPYSRNLLYSQGLVNLPSSNKRDGFSIRCLRD